MIFYIFSVFCINEGQLSKWNILFNWITTTIGLFLGYNYYRLRMQYEQENSKRERIRGRIDYILNDLNRLDAFVEEMLNLLARDNETEAIQEIKAKLERGFELISVYLEKNDHLLGFSKDEEKSILAVSSFVDAIIKKIENDDNKDQNFKKDKIKYIPIIQEARTTCVQKVEQI